MPREVIQRVMQIGRDQNIPNTLTFADHCGNELENHYDKVHDNENDDDSNHYNEEDEESNDKLSFD